MLRILMGYVKDEKLIPAQVQALCQRFKSGM